MSHQFVPPDPKALAASRAVKAQYFRPILQDLMEMGMALARETTALPPAGAAEAVAAIERISIVFERASRAVRCCILILLKLDNSPVRPVGPQESRIARPSMLHAVEDNIMLYANEALEDAIHDQVEDWLDSMDVDYELDDDTISELVAVICRDLGLASSPAAQRWTRTLPKDILDLCARAARPWSTIGPV